MIHGFLHVAAIGKHWQAVLADQLAMLRETGLLDASESVTIGLVGADRSALPPLPQKVKVACELPNVGEFEFPTLDALHRHCQAKPGSLVWYGHTKGVSKHGEQRDAFADDWRRWMEWATWEQWRNCRDLLRTHDTVGGDLRPPNEVKPGWFPCPHYAGNFWWARSDYVAKLAPVREFARSLPVPQDRRRRYQAEFWIGSGTMPRMACISRSLDRKPYAKPWPRSEYTDAVHPLAPLVVIPTRGHFDYAAEACRSVGRTCPDAFTLVVDDASPVWSNDVLRELLAIPRVAVQRFLEPGGLSRSWNAGLIMARKLDCRFAVCANSDVVFGPRWWEPLRSALDRRDFAGPVTNAPGHQPRQNVARYVDGYEVSDDPERIEATCKALAGKEPETTHMLNGFCMAARTETWWRCMHSLGAVFNPAIPLAGNEDELWKRCRPSCAVVPSSFVFHYRGVSRGLVGPSGGHARKQQRAAECVHLGPVVDRHGKTCGRCWSRQCEKLGTIVKQNAECEGCPHYEPV